MLEAELMRFFSGQWQSGTGVNAGPITGYPTGGNTHDPSHPTDYSDGTNGSDNLGSQDYCDNQPISSDSFYDENGNLIFIDMTIRAPELVPGGPSNTIDFIFDRVSYAEYRIQVFVDGDFAHRDILADHPGWLYETIDEHFEPGHVHDDETGGNKFSVRATFGTAMRDVISASGLLFGEGGDDGLTGGAGSDTIDGGEGNDWLDGGAGGDLLDGGAGWDVVSYLAMAGGIVVDMTTNQNGGAALGDRLVNIEVVQGTNANDTIVGVDRGNGSGVELHGEGGNDGLTGRAGSDRLFGDAGADTLAGGAGGDTLDGGNGDDSLSGDAGADLIDGGAGRDIATYAAATSGVSVSLEAGIGSLGDAAGDRLVSIEGLTGSAYADQLVGDVFDNTLSGGNGFDLLNGGDGADTLDGGSGNDTLAGGAGSDLLTGGQGRDVFTFDWAPTGASNLDRIQDFNASEDKILLKGSVFTGLAAGALSARAFTVGAEATSKEHRIVYNEATGEVSYDVDGSGARAAIKFAVLTPGATLWADHFLVG
jgi:Ca2+-binding RTX toxin-like protein